MGETNCRASRAASLAGRMAVAGTAVLGLGGFVLSFTALRDLAVMVGMPADLAWIWPLLIDGLIIEATLAVVRLSQLRSRASWYAWALLAGGAIVSVGSNGVHAVATGHGVGGAAASAVAPVVLLAVTHLTVLLLERPADEPAEVLAEPGPVAPSQEPGVPTPEADAAPAGSGEHPEEVEDGARAVDLEQWVRELDAQGRRVTGAMVAELLGVSASTGRRRLAAIRRNNRPRLRLAQDEDRRHA